MKLTIKIDDPTEGFDVHELARELAGDVRYRFASMKSVIFNSAGVVIIGEGHVRGKDGSTILGDGGDF